MLLLTLILLPFVGGAAVGVLSRKNSSLSRRVTLLALAGELALSLLLLLRMGTALAFGGLCGIGLTFSAAGLQVLLSILASLLWLVSGFVSYETMAEDRHAVRYELFLLLTLGAIQGVFLSGDLYTTLVFFEVMSFTSLFWVFHSGTEKAKRAAGSYLAYAVIGGLVSLMGLFLLSTMLGTLRFDDLPEAVAAYEGSKAALYTAGGLSMATFAAKVCMFGIMGITAKIFLGDAQWGKVLLVFAAATMLWGGFMALCQTNLKKVLAYSSMSQIGFILTGIAVQALLGEKGGMAAWGSVLHLTNHALIKLVLFLAAGLLFSSVGSLELEDLRGFGRNKPVLLVIFLCPALAVMGIPLFSGYISKTLIHESIVEYIGILESAGQSAVFFHVIEWLFLIAGGMTVGYMTKLLVCLFAERDEKHEAQSLKASPAVQGILAACAVLLPILGLTPHLTMEGIARFAQDFLRSEGPEETVHYFSLGNLKGAAISIAIGAVLYFGFVRTAVRRKEGAAVAYRNPWPAALDLENGLYRPLLMVWLPFAGAVAARFAASLFEWLTALVNKVLFFRFDPIVHPKEDEKFANYDPKPQGRRGNTGTLAFGLTLFGIGYMVVMIYLLLRQFVF